MNEKKSEVGSECRVSGRHLSLSELVDLVDRVRDLKDRAMILFLMDSGLETEELAQLDLDAITYTTHELPDGRVQTIGRGSIPVAKSGKSKEFFLSARTVEAMNLYWNTLRQQDGNPALFTSIAGVRLRPKMIAIVLREWYDRLGIPKLRHREVRTTTRQFHRGNVSAKAAEGHVNQAKS